MHDTNSGSETQRARLALIGFRYDENSSFMKGAADAPPQIRAALRSEASNLWSESGIDLAPPSVFFDAGDVEPVPGTEMFSLIEDSIRTMLNDQLGTISLGGDHSITYPIIKAFREKYDGLSIPHFDAHPDLYDDLQANRLSQW
jgi:arginase family enzyme